MYEPHNTAMTVITAEGQEVTPAPLTIIRPLGTAAEIKAAWDQFQELKQAILTADDYQEVGGKARVKKSGWRKIAAAFGISLEEVRGERIENEGGAGFRWEYTVRAIAPNGRFCDGIGTFDSRERRMAHMEHDVRATAFTRAANRAVSDLVGGGEVSAEEIHEEHTDWDNAPRTVEHVRLDVPGCAECGAALEETRFRDGTSWPPTQLAKMGQRKHGRVLCMGCYRKANAARVDGPVV
jgi:hypothetical protein